MATFRDIWNLIITGDTSDVDKKVKELGKTAESTGATAETSFRNRMGTALSNFAEKIPGVSGLMDKFGISGANAGALVGTAVAGGALAAGVAVEKFVNVSIEEFQKQAQEVLHFKEVTGLAATEASRFVAVAGDYAVSAEDLSAAIGKMDKAAGATPEKLKALGIEIGKTSSGGYDAQQTFLNVVDAFNATDDASRKAEIGAAAFGKGWQSVVKLLDVGSAQIQTSFGKVQDFQLFSDADLKKSEDYRHAMDDLNDAIKGFEREVGQALLPVITRAVHELKNLAEHADTVAKPFGGLPGVFEKAATGIGWVISGLNHYFNPVQHAIDLTHGFKSAWDAVFGGGGDDGAKLSKGFDNVGNAANTQTEAILRAAAAVDAHKLAMDQAADSAKIYMQTNQGLRDALDQQRTAQEKLTQATDDYRRAANDLRNSQLGLEGSIYSARDAMDAYAGKVADSTSTLRDQDKANLAVKLSLADVEQKALDAATQQAALHGATLTANGAIAAQLSALQLLYSDGMLPELRKEIDEYALALYNIPGQIVTNVDLTGNGLDVLGRAIGGTRPEGTGAGGAGGTLNGSAIVSSIKSYEASNGTAWRSGPQ